MPRSVASPDELEVLRAKIEILEKRQAILEKALADVHGSIFSLGSFDTTARMIFDACRAATGATAGYVAMLMPDANEQDVIFLEAGGLPCTVDPSLPMPVRGLRAEAYTTKKPVFLNDFMASDFVNFLPPGHVELETVMFAPIIVGGEAKGIIGLANKPGGFSDEDQTIAGMYGEIAAISLQAGHLVETITRSEDQLKESADRASFLKDVLAHDVNNILAVIQSNADLILMQERHHEKDIESLEAFVTRIQEQVTRCSTLINNIQKLAYIESTGLPPTAMDILEPLTIYLANIPKRYPSRMIEASIEAPEGASVVMVQANELFDDVLETIMANAVKYNDKDVVRIAVRVSEEDIDGAGQVRVEIADNGPGIENDRKRSIFDRMDRLNSTTRGMGIALSVAKRIMDSCGGNIWAEDAVQGDSAQGSKFVLLFKKQ
jgi:K+-sensing histidine kinase KdpD